MTARARRAVFIALGREAEKSYDRVERSLHRGCPTNPTLPKIDARIGLPIWQAIVSRGEDPDQAGKPEMATLIALGSAATLAIDFADRGRIGGSVDDVYARIGEKLWDIVERSNEANVSVAPAGP